MLQKSVCWNKDPEQPKINKNYTHTHTHTPFSSSPLTPWEGPNFFARHTGWGLSCLLRMPSTPTPLPLPCQLGNFSFSHSWFKYCLPDYTVVCAPLQCWLHACCSLHWTVFSWARATCTRGSLGSQGTWFVWWKFTQQWTDPHKMPSHIQGVGPRGHDPTTFVVISRCSGLANMRTIRWLYWANH